MQYIQLISLVPQIVVLAAMVYLLTRRRSAAAILLVISQAMGIASTGFTYYVLSTTLPTQEKSDLLNINGVQSGLSTILFTIGFCLLIFDYVSSISKPVMRHDVLDANPSPGE